MPHFSPDASRNRELAALGGELRGIRGRLDRLQDRLDGLCQAVQVDEASSRTVPGAESAPPSRVPSRPVASAGPAVLTLPEGETSQDVPYIRVDPTDALHARLRSARLRRMPREASGRLRLMARAAGLIALFAFLAIALAPLLFRAALEQRGIHAHRLAWIGIADLFAVALAARLFRSLTAARLTTLIAALVSIQWLALGWFVEAASSGTGLQWNPRFATGAALALACWLAARVVRPFTEGRAGRGTLPLLGHVVLLTAAAFQFRYASLIAFWSVAAWVVAVLSARRRSGTLRALSFATWMMPLAAWLRMSIPWLAGSSAIPNSDPFFDLRFAAAVPIMLFGLWSARLIRRRQAGAEPELRSGEQTVCSRRQRRRSEPPLAPVLALVVNAIFLVGFVLQWHHLPEQLRGGLPPLLRHSTVGFVWTLDLAILWGLAFRWGVFTARLGAWLLSVVAIAGHVVGGGLHWPRSLAEFVPFANERFLGTAVLAAVFFWAAWLYSHTKAQMAAGAPGYRRRRALWWGEAWAGIAAGLIGHALLLGCIVLDVRAWLAQARALEIESLAGAVAARQFLYTGIAATYFTIVGLIGMATRRRPLRVLALGGFAGVAVKLFFVDLASVPILYRTGAVAAVAALLLAARRFRAARWGRPSRRLGLPHVVARRDAARTAGQHGKPYSGRTAGSNRPRPPSARQ